MSTERSEVLGSRTGSSISIHLLVKKVKKKDMGALVDWMETRKSKYYKIGWAYLRNRHDVEDVFHNTLIKAYENIHQLREKRYFETWFTAIFINECNYIYRRRTRLIYSVDHLTDEIVGLDSDLELFEQLDSLDVIYKEPIILQYLSGYSQAEISVILEIPIGTVKSRIYRGLRMLRQSMRKEVRSNEM